MHNFAKLQREEDLNGDNVDDDMPEDPAQDTISMAMQKANQL